VPVLLGLILAPDGGRKTAVAVRADDRIDTLGGDP
jgi:hypothetical protein